MTSTLSFNPAATTNAPGSFNVTSAGYIQGLTMDQPAVRYALCGGLLASTETLPMWGGIAISESLQSHGVTIPRKDLGNVIVRATSLASTIPITGWSVYDQLHSTINFPQSPVPVTLSNGQVNFYRLGSGARIPVACSPSLVSMETGLINQNVSWNFAGGFLQPYDAATATVSITSMTWAATNGGQIAVVAGAAVTTVVGIGDLINISGATSTGTGGNAAVNGTFQVNTFTDNQHFTVLAPGTAGYYGTIAGTILAQEGTVALSTIGVRVIDIQIGNCMTVNYNTGTGFATWNQTGSVALLLI
jgi:hypothetical protein